MMSISFLTPILGTDQHPAGALAMPADQITSPADIPLMTVIRRGLSRRCPNCGKGAVLSGYLTRVPVCGSCGEDLSHISADDGPAWATLIVVGHVLAPFLIILGRDERIPVWVAIGALAAMMLAGVWWCLPRFKGLFIALIWRTGATGEDVFAHPAADDAESHNRRNG